MTLSLTHFLESSPQPISYHIAVNICHDVTLALSFLHSNKIVHRDLSSNNVLLIGNLRAKVTDFGMARLGDINPQATRFTSTMCPGTDVYMPPEAVEDKAMYTEKIDCFSFGVITLQILTRLFPKPGDRFIDVNDPRYPRPLKMPVLEIDRRQNHISQVDQDHPLLPVILDCLNNKDNERPLAHQLCERVGDLKRMDKYIDSARTVQDKDEAIQSLTTCVEERDVAISSKEEENQQLREQLRQSSEEKQEVIRDKLESLTEKDRQLEHCRQVLRDKQREYAELTQMNERLQQERDQASRRSKERERQLGRVNQQLQEAEVVVAQFERRVAELEQLLSQKDKRNPEASSRGEELKCREGKKAPHGMSRLCDAVVDGNKKYVRDKGTVNIIEVEEVIKPFKIFCVYEEDEDSRNLIKFARSKIPDYNPRAGYGYYEFTKRGYVLPERNVMALNKNGKLYTGPGVRALIGAAGNFSGTTELDPPMFTESDKWDCAFIQGKSYGRVLVNNTRFLYCEYDMSIN